MQDRSVVYHSITLNMSNAHGLCIRQSQACVVHHIKDLLTFVLVHYLYIIYNNTFTLLYTLVYVPNIMLHAKRFSKTKLRHVHVYTYDNTCTLGLKKVREDNIT